MEQKVNLNNIQIKVCFRFYDFLIQQGFQISFYNNEYGYLGKGFCLGLENKRRDLRILFVKETEVPQIELLIGSLSAPFDNPDKRASRRTGGKGWFRLVSLIEFFLGRRLYSAEEYETFDEIKFQSIISKRIEPHLSSIVKALSSEQNMEIWLDKYFDFIATRSGT